MKKKKKKKKKKKNINILFTKHNILGKMLLNKINFIVFWFM